MKCKIVGFVHVKGEKSRKTGKPYDFYKVSVLYNSRNYTGETALEVLADPSQVMGIEKLTLPVVAELAQEVGSKNVTVCL